jgi:hypothetical protein
VRDLQFQHHNRDDNSNHTIAERGQTFLAHGAVPAC